MREEEITKLKDINEGVQNIILELLRNANLFKIKNQYISRYNVLKEIYSYISPFDFKAKDTLTNMTIEIDDAIEQSGTRGLDMSHKIVIEQKKYEVRSLIDIYFQMIIHSLKELNLYLKIVRRQDDPDEQFSEETFTTNKSLIDEKKAELKKMTSEQLISYLTPRNIHDVHARFLVDKAIKL